MVYPSTLSLRARAPRGHRRRRSRRELGGGRAASSRAPRRRRRRAHRARTSRDDDGRKWCVATREDVQCSGRNALHAARVRNRRVHAERRTERASARVLRQRVRAPVAGAVEVEIPDGQTTGEARSFSFPSSTGYPALDVFRTLGRRERKRRRRGGRSSAWRADVLVQVAHQVLRGLVARENIPDVI